VGVVPHASQCPVVVPHCGPRNMGVVPHKGAKYTGVVPQAERDKWEG